MWITPSGNQRPNADFYVDKVVKRPEDYRVLERMPFDKESIPVKFKDTGKPVKWITILDTETTGLTSDAEVLELAIVRCGVDASDHLCSLDEVVDEFNDPGFEIPAEVSDLTGITDNMVRNKSVDIAKVNHVLRDDPVVIAHNAKFDRPFFEKLFKDDCHKWACSMEYFDWYGRGFGTRKLGMLLEREGFFFDAHRAYMDCLAVAFMLYLVPESLKEILKPRIKITAGGNSFDVKEILKERGYTFDWNKKVWHITRLSGVNEEMAFLKNLYPDGSLSTKEDNRVVFKA